MWNLWWIGYALHSHVWPLWCAALFVPFGVDLTLHTLTPLPTALVALLSPGSSAVAGTNAIIAAHLFLNFAVAYALAWRLTRSIAAAAVGALLFGWSPYMEVRLLGHFNLIAGWTLALTALATIEALDRRSTLSAMSLGVAIAITAYIEYYYAVYAAALVVVLACTRSMRLTWHARIRGRWHRRALVILAAGVVIACVLALVIRISGGFAVRIGGLSASMKSAHNPLAAASVLTMIGLAITLATGGGLRIHWHDVRRVLPALLTAAGVAAVLVSPLLVSGLTLWLRGDYVSQRYLWRSAPAGVDIGTLLLGNPRSLLWHGLPIAAYRTFGIDEIEQTTWLSPGALCLCIVALRRRSESPEIRLWIVVAALFGLWALGPSLVVFGRSSPIILPATLLRYVPIVSNARIPGRALVLVYLSAAMLGAYGCLLLRQRGHIVSAVACAALALADLLPARPPILNVERPPIYQALRAQTQSGAVCELPLGLRDSFGVTGLFDPWILWHQTIHERPMAGGFVSRLPSRITTGYLASPVLGSFLRLSAGGRLDAEPAMSPEAASAILAADGIAFIVVNRAQSPPALLEYVDRFGFDRVASDGPRELLRVERRSAADNRSPR